MTLISLNKKINGNAVVPIFFAMHILLIVQDDTTKNDWKKNVGISKDGRLDNLKDKER